MAVRLSQLLAPQRSLRVDPRHASTMAAMSSCSRRAAKWTAGRAAGKLLGACAGRRREAECASIFAALKASRSGPREGVSTARIQF